MWFLDLVCFVCHPVAVAAVVVAVVVIVIFVTS